MKSIFNILLHVLVFQYFRKYFPVFLIILIFTVGIMQPPLLLFSDSFLLSVATGISLYTITNIFFLLYFLTLVYFIMKYLHTNENMFVYNLCLCPKAKLVTVLALLFTILFFPVVLYQALLLRISYINKEAIIFAITSLLLLFYYFLFISIFLRTIRKPRDISYNILLQQIFKTFINTIPFIYLSNVITGNKGRFLILNLFSFVILSALWLIPDEYSTKEIITMVFFINILVNSTLVYMMRDYEDRWLTLLRSLPIKLYVRFSYYLLTFVLFHLFDFIFLAIVLLTRHLPFDFFVIYLFSFIAVTMLINSMFFIFQPKKISLAKILFLIVLVIIVGILFKTVLIILSLLALTSYLLFYFYYYRFHIAGDKTF